MRPINRDTRLTPLFLQRIRECFLGDLKRAKQELLIPWSDNKWYCCVRGEEISTADASLVEQALVQWARCHTVDTPVTTPRVCVPQAWLEELEASVSNPGGEEPIAISHKVTVFSRKKRAS